MPTYWKASLEPINPEELGRYQFHRLVQDAAGTIFVAHQPSEDQAAIWLLCIRDVWIEMMGREVSLLDQNKSLMLAKAMRHVSGWYYAERQLTDRWGRQRVFRREGVPQAEFM